jgi:F0F1-type ATP synthase assembly protein I
MADLAVTTSGVRSHRKPLYMDMSVQVFAGMVIGAGIGWLWPGTAEWMRTLGELFIRLIGMLVGRIIFCAIVALGERAFCNAGAKSARGAGDEPGFQASTSASSIRLPNGSQKKASLRLIAGRMNGSVTMVTPRDFSVAIVSSTLFTVRQKW